MNSPLSFLTNNKQSLGGILVIIETLVFLLPALTLFYLIYQEDISFDTTQVLILAGILMLVLGGLLIVRNIFMQLKKLHALVMSAIPTSTESTTREGGNDPLQDVFTSFNDLVTRYEVTDTELQENTADLVAIHELSQLASRTLNFDELLQAFLNIAMQVTNASSGSIYTRASEGTAMQEFVNAGKIQLPTDFLESVVEAGAPVLQQSKQSTDSIAGLPIIVRGELVAILTLSAASDVLSSKTRPGQVFTLMIAEIGFALHNAMLHKNLEDTVASRTQQLEKRNAELTGEVRTRKEAETKLAAAKQQAESANYAKSRFLANIGHELLTPLGVVIGFSDVLLSESHGALNPEQCRFSGHILTSGQQLKTLVQDILTTVRLESDRIDLDRQNCDIGTELNRVMTVARAAAEEKSITLESHFAESMPTVSIDSTLIDKLFNNLLRNAIKFSPENSKVSIRTRVGNGEELIDCSPENLRLSENVNSEALFVLIEVADQGQGYDDSAQEKMFALFEQADNSREREAGGSGLGLAMSSKIVDLHGGYLWSSSGGQNSGSSFFVALPVAPH